MQCTTDVDTLNEWVYAELFLTPSSDPWLGLAPTMFTRRWMTTGGRNRLRRRQRWWMSIVAGTLRVP